MASKVCKRTLCVKNLPQPSDTQVSKLFGPLGGVLLKVITTGDNNRKDILVEFESEELASKAREAMHGKLVDGTNLFVDYAIFGQPSFTSPSKDKAQKQKVSVLDRIIKPGNVKSSKAEDKTAVAGGQANGKEGSGPDNQDNSNTSQQKPANDAKLEKGQVVSQSNIVKKGKAGDNTQQNNGSYEGKNNRGQNKKSYILHQGKRGSHKIQRKLEIIKPKQEPARALEDKSLVMPKEVSTIMKDNPELTGNPQLVKTVFELVQKKLEITNKDIASRTTSKSRHYDSAVKNKPYSRSRSRSRGPSYPRPNRSSSRGKPDSYYHSNPRRSTSPSSNQKHPYRPRSRSRSKSYDRNTSSRRDYPQPRDPYYDNHYKDADPYYRRSRSRSGSKRGDYSPYRDRHQRRDDRYYGNRDRSGSRGRLRSRSRSHSWNRSLSRHGYHDYRNRHSRSRSRSHSGYRDPAYRKEEERGTFKSRYVTKGGLVIEKKNSVRKYESTYARDSDARYDRREYSRSRSRDRRYLHSRSRSRDKGAVQSGNDYYRYRDRSYGKHTEGDRNKKALDIRKDNTMEQELRNRKQTSNSKQTERNKDANSNHREKMELDGVVKGADTTDLGSVTADGTNQLYNYADLAQFFPTSYSNPLVGSHIPDQNSASSLPTYLYASSVMDPNGLSHIQSGDPQLGTNFSLETMAVQNGYNVHKNELEGERGANKTKEEMENLNLENSTTENSNIDVGRTEEKGDLLEQTLAYEEKGDPNNTITNDFIKKNKMQAFINYIIATGDIQGLKEKLKSIEKPK